MVRTIVGTLVEIGRGHRPVGWIDEVLAAQNRIAAGSCAPAQDSTFVSVRYQRVFCNLGSAFGSLVRLGF